MNFLYQQILDQNKGHLAKNRSSEETTKEVESIFSDRDFDKFEEEYDFFK